MEVTMDRQSLLLLPELDCSDLTLQIARDLFPGIQTVRGRSKPIRMLSARR